MCRLLDIHTCGVYTKVHIWCARFSGRDRSVSRPPHLVLEPFRAQTAPYALEEP